MFSTPKIIDELTLFLQSKRHSCMNYNKLTGNFNWCCKDTCPSNKKIINDMHKRNG